MFDLFGGVTPALDRANQLHLVNYLALMIDGRAEKFSLEEFDSIIQDANKLGIPFEQLCREEIAARRKLERITPTFAEFVKMAEQSGAPQYMAGETGGQCPF